MPAPRELAKYKFDFVGVHKVSWDKGDSVKVEDNIFFNGIGNKNHKLGTD